MMSVARAGVADARALGGNMYGTPSQNAPAPADAKPTTASAPSPGAKGGGGPSEDSSADAKSESPKTKRASTAKAELSFLAGLVDVDDDDVVGGGGGAFRLALFDGDDVAGASFGEDAGSVLRLDGTAQRKTAAELMRDLDLGDDTKPGAKPALDEMDDLLDLMDGLDDAK